MWNVTNAFIAKKYSRFYSKCLKAAMEKVQAKTSVKTSFMNFLSALEEFSWATNIMQILSSTCVLSSCPLKFSPFPSSKIWLFCSLNPEEAFCFSG